MNREGIKKHHKVFEAWLNGAEVEYRTHDSGPWGQTDSQPLFLVAYEYRVKEPSRTLSGWLNIVIGEDGDVWGQGFPSRQRADGQTLMQVNGTVYPRAACVEFSIPFKVGDGLECRACISWYGCLGCGHSWQRGGPHVADPPCPECGTQRHKFLMEHSKSYRKVHKRMNKQFVKAMREAMAPYQGIFGNES